MNAKQFKEAVQALYLQYFPNGYISQSRLRLGNGVCITAGLIGDIDDVISKIRLNDPLQVQIYIHENIIFDDEKFDLDDLQLEFERSFIKVVPANPKYYYCESSKIPARKFKAPADVVLDKLDLYFSKVKKAVQAEATANNIIEQNRIPEKYLYVVCKYFIMILLTVNWIIKNETFISCCTDPGTPLQYSNGGTGK